MHMLHPPVKGDVDGLCGHNALLKQTDHLPGPGFLISSRKKKKKEKK